MLGICFLGGQVIGWKQLVNQGFHLEGNISSSFFYILTLGARHPRHRRINRAGIRRDSGVPFSNGSGETDCGNRERGLLAFPRCTMVGADGTVSCVVLEAENSF